MGDKPFRSHPKHQNPAATTNTAEPANRAIRGASPLGMLPVAASPRYHAPTSVSSPFCVNMALLGPTFDTEDRKAPKYE
ncbi:hypothetical protein BST61_g10888 [Cercospora zeina]